MNACIQKHKIMYIQIKILIYLYVYTILTTNIHVCLNKYKLHRNQSKFLITKFFPNHPKKLCYKQDKWLSF